MKIGIVTNYSMGMFESLKALFNGLESTQVDRHEIVYRPLEYLHAYRNRQMKINQDFLNNCDLLLGVFEPELLEARERLNKHVPYVGLLLGTMPRGALNLIKDHKFMRTTDVLVGNCEAEVELTRMFFRNARTGLLPFPFDESNFNPLDAASRQALRANFGIGADDPVMLYSGRISLEKNVYTVLRVFSVLRSLIPNLRLGLAGSYNDVPFWEFGVFPMGIQNTLLKATEQLGIPKESILIAGKRSIEELRGMYNMADVVINLTLHHDENFGLAQVEAMACGTPVIGTNWGGLKDTIIEGETGYKVSTVVTGTGAKLNWWEAINKIFSFFADKARHQHLREASARHAKERYSLAQFGRILEAILLEAQATERESSEPLTASPFAEEYWKLCVPKSGEPPPYKRGERSFQLYRELIAPFAGLTEESIPHGEKLEPAHVLSLGAPVIQTDGSIAIYDPIFPVELTLPEVHRETIRATFEALSAEPVITFDRLKQTYLSNQKDDQAALAWMLEMGLLLRSEPGIGSVEPSRVGSAMSRPLFSVSRVDPSTNILVIG